MALFVVGALALLVGRALLGALLVGSLLLLGALALFVGGALALLVGLLLLLGGLALLAVRCCCSARWRCSSAGALALFVGSLLLLGALALFLRSLLLLVEAAPLLLLRSLLLLLESLLVSALTLLVHTSTTLLVLHSLLFESALLRLQLLLFAQARDALQLGALALLVLAMQLIRALPLTLDHTALRLFELATLEIETAALFGRALPGRCVARALLGLDGALALFDASRALADPAALVLELSQLASPALAFFFSQLLTALDLRANHLLSTQPILPRPGFAILPSAELRVAPALGIESSHRDEIDALATIGTRCLRNTSSLGPVTHA